MLVDERAAIFTSERRGSQPLYNFGGPLRSCLGGKENGKECIIGNKTRWRLRGGAHSLCKVKGSSIPQRSNFSQSSSAGYQL